MPKKPVPKPVKGFNLKPAMAALGTLVLVAAVYFTIVWLGEQAGGAIANNPRYQVKFDALDVATPPGVDRATFLAEVRYLANPPAEFSNADPAVPQKLADAFAKHPWVVSASPAAWPKPVTLTFRTPALVVVTKDAERVVDGTGVLLPASAGTANLPKLVTPQPLPNMAAGEVWKSRDVLRAIDIAKDYDAVILERAAEGWKLKQKNGRSLTLSR